MAVTALLALLIPVGYYSARRSQAELEREQQERRLRTIAEIRSGRGDVMIWDAELLEMLVDDPQCVQTVTSIHFFMADLGDPRFRRVREFENVNNIGFYDCGNADNVIVAAKDMASIESLFFEVTRISSESLKSLAAFPNLKKVRFEQVVADETIDELSRLLPDVAVEAPFPASSP
ncbi:MAG: hypothetical protein ISR77_17460 [Pirellulaceae bacterium]|nr:hypothetical protein [Pirellulaceae bacterium]